MKLLGYNEEELHERVETGVADAVDDLNFAKTEGDYQYAVKLITDLVMFQLRDLDCEGGEGMHLLEEGED